jgi:electron transfer flavoprotein beta subunit
MRLDRLGPLVVNPFDLNAIEEALRLREQVSEREILALTLGPEGAWEALQKALAMGVDRAALISSDGAEGSDLVATSYVLAKVLEREGCDLILFGQQSADADGALLWAAVGERLRMPVVSQASELAIAHDRATVRRQTEFGYERIEVPLPAVVSVADSINEPRRPSLRGMMAAKKKPIEEVSLDEVGVDGARIGAAGSRTVVYRLDRPPQGREGAVIEDDGNAPESIVAFLRERGLVS